MSPPYSLTGPEITMPIDNQPRKGANRKTQNLLSSAVEWEKTKDGGYITLDEKNGYRVSRKAETFVGTMRSQPSKAPRPTDDQSPITQSTLPDQRR